MKTKLATMAIALLLVGCTVRGGWPRFLRKGESSGWSGPKQSQPQNTTPSNVSEQEYPLAERIAKRDGTNYIGVYMGMIAEHDGNGGVLMYSATSGECLKYIPYEDFRDIFVLKTKPEYR